MNQILKSIIVGIVQGLTEFLPVSSSGHIVIAQEILNLKYSEEQNLLFAIILHFATALSTIVIFRKDIASIFKGLFQFKWNKDTQFSVMIMLSMIPAACVGLFLKDFLAELFSSLKVVGASLLVTSVLLFESDRSINRGREVSFKNSFVIGIVQAISALLPGLSRSGSTISASMLLGIDKAKAARFSFLMVLPLILGAVLKMMLDIKAQPMLSLTDSMDLIALMAGFIAAFLAGIFACRWMISLVKKSRLTYFGIYCLIIGAGIIFYDIYFV